MPGTLESRKRGEFFKGGLNIVIKALRSIGQGDLYLFTSNRIESIQKLTLTKADIPEDSRPSFLPGEYNVEAQPVTEQIPVRKSPRFDPPFLLPSTYAIDKDTAEALARGDAPTSRAIERLGQVRRSPRLAGDPIVFQATPGNLERLVQGGRKATRAAQALRQVRRSPRLNPGVVG